MDLRKIAPELKLTQYGCWASTQLSDVAYPEEGNSLCFAVEDSSFWFRHRNYCILEVIRQFPPSGAVFDIGGGNGCVAHAIQESGTEVVLVEPGVVGVQNALKRGIKHVVRATLEDLGALPETMAAVGLFDVLEHIPDDSAFMAAVYRLLIPGGRVYITVPAYPWLWSQEDVIAGHSRRYTIRTLTPLLSTGGYTVDFATYFFGFLPLPILFRRVMPYRLGFAATTTSPGVLRSGHDLGPLATRLIARLTDREVRRLRKKSPLSWGGSLLAVAHKGS